MLMPPRGTMAMGKFDQRCRCFSSSKAYNTVFLCWSSSFERNAFAALTIRAVAVCAIAGVSDKHMRPKAQIERSVLVERNLISPSSFQRRSSDRSHADLPRISALPDGFGGRESDHHQCAVVGRG